ncbi:MAG TPA: hypothetical protein PKA10_17585 [Selenomonadales bacterium]|nr:hypothetical protein [Selenomonadales bacterium]
MFSVNTELIRLARATQKAMQQTGSTVVRVNPDMLLDAAGKLEAYPSVAAVGVKNTGQILRRVIKRLVESGGYVWHTVDAMAEGGRAIDPALTNPLTLRPMTGSSSATALNVLYGINDLGLATDGGGSVLAPAISLNLAAVMAKGLGLAGAGARISTDKIRFTPGLGVISHDYKLAREAILALTEAGQASPDYRRVSVAVCRPGQISLPDGTDMYGRLRPAIDCLQNLGCRVEPADFPDFADRQQAIDRTQALCQRYDCLLTYEGPVDLLGIGDSVLGGMGAFARNAQQQSGKYLVKIANMINATAVALPADEAASGLLIAAREGREPGQTALALAGHLRELYPQPGLYQDYFRGGLTRRSDDLLFSLKE